MKKSSDVGIGVGVAGPSWGQAVVLVMEGIACFAPLNPTRHQMTQRHSQITVIFR